VDPSWDWKKKDEIEKWTEAKSLDGIISYLTKKHDGNVEEKRIVTITSKSVKVQVKVKDSPWYSLANIADLTRHWCFKSEDEPSQ
jgi:hypothetical protein